MFFKRYKIPEEIKNIDRALIHITDTPNACFPFVKALMKEIQPEVIVHTGDMVDNYKLERSARNMVFYVKDLMKLSEIFKLTQAKKVILTLGNHDKEDSVKTHFSNAIRTTESYEWIEGGMTFAAAHYHDMLKESNAKYKLFGHSMTVESNDEQGLYNGLQYVHIFDLDNGKVYKLKYPVGTDQQRMLLFRGGL